jgi:hypothetical protein
MHIYKLKMGQNSLECLKPSFEANMQLVEVGICLISRPKKLVVSRHT